MPCTRETIPELSTEIQVSVNAINLMYDDYILLNII